MIFFTTAGTYTVKFFYERNLGGIPVITECKIYEGAPPFEEGTQPISSGIATLSLFDNPNKSIGRKVALTRALKTLRREIREQIWLGYFGYIGKY